MFCISCRNIVQNWDDLHLTQETSCKLGCSASHAGNIVQIGMFRISCWTHRAKWDVLHLMLETSCKLGCFASHAGHIMQSGMFRISCWTYRAKWDVMHIRQGTSYKLGCSASYVKIISSDTGPNVSNAMRSRGQLTMQTVPRVTIDLVQLIQPNHSK